MYKEFFPYARQSIDAADALEVSKAIFSTTITRGPRVDAFEHAVAEYCGAKHAVAFSSGSAALLAAYHVVDTNKNDRIISTPNTFVSSVGTGVELGATPVFVDIDLDTGNMNLEQTEFTLDMPRSRGKTLVVPVHFSGIPVDMQKLETMIKDPDTVIIEDAAHALGSQYLDGKRVGCCEWSQMTVFSFHPAKTITTGEGGMVTTNDDDLFHKLKRFRNNGIERETKFLEREAAPWYYEVQELTNNYNFTEIQAALGLSQFKRLDNFVQKRQKLVSVYREQLADMKDVRLFTQAFDSSTAFHLMVLQIDFKAYKTSRTEVMYKLKDQGVGSQLHYIPLYRHPYFKKVCGDISEYFPKMEEYYERALSIPLYYDLRVEDVEYVVHTLKNVLNH